MDNKELEKADDGLSEDIINDQVSSWCVVKAQDWYYNPEWGRNYTGTIQDQKEYLVIRTINKKQNGKISTIMVPKKTFHTFDNALEWAETQADLKDEWCMHHVQTAEGIPPTVLDIEKYINLSSLTPTKTIKHPYWN